MRKLKKYAGGGSVKIEDPNTTLIDNQIMKAKASEEANSNPWIQSLEMLGNMGLQAGAQIGGPKAAAIGSTIQTADYLTMAFGGRVKLKPMAKDGYGGGGRIPQKNDKEEDINEKFIRTITTPQKDPSGKGLVSFKTSDYFADKYTVDTTGFANGDSKFPYRRGNKTEGTFSKKELEEIINKVSHGKLKKIEDLVNTDLKPEESGFAFGGQVQGEDVEVEGKEVAESPDGTAVKFKGKSHEQGGIKTNLPEGTEIFSDRIEVDGETIAKRKEKRLKRIGKLEKRLKENPQDSTLRQTYQRMQENDEIIDNQEMQLQEMIKTVMQTNQPASDSTDLVEYNEGEEFAFGGTVDPGMLALLAQAMDPNTSAFNQENMFPNTFGSQPQSGAMPRGKTSPMEKKGFDINGMPKGGTSPTPKLAEEGGVPDSKSAEDYLGMIPDTGITGGDAVGMLGNLISTFGPGRVTDEARANDRPNINYFEDYGEDALDTLDDSKQFLDEQKAGAKQDLELSKRTAMNKNRKSARGVNTMRALDLATNAQGNKTERAINSDFAEKMMAILGQEAGLENQRDFRQMFGEQQKDIADRMDQGAYYTNKAQDVVSKGQGIQKIGGDLNDIQQQKQMENLLSTMSKYFNIDSQGNITKK